MKLIFSSNINSGPLPSKCDLRIHTSFNCCLSVKIYDIKYDLKIHFDKKLILMISFLIIDMA